MTAETANPLELLRVLVSGTGLLVAWRGWLDARRLLAMIDQDEPVGRRHVMQAGAVRNYGLWMLATGLLLGVALLASSTPDGAQTVLSIASNLGQAIVAGIITLVVILDRHDRASSELVERAATAKRPARRRKGEEE
jgi:hypothetical protein